LAKYLLIVAKEDAPELNIQDIPAFFRHLLERVDWQTDLHFQTCTTIDTLDYSGTGLNEGSKVVIAAAGPARRNLATSLPGAFSLPDGFGEPQVCLPGILAIKGPPYKETGEAAIERLTAMLAVSRPSGPLLDDFPLILIVDDSSFAARTLNNWIWVAFTRSNPAYDLHGIGAFTRKKHWGCAGPLIIDARIKPHHAPPLEEDPEVAKRVDALGARGGPLYRII
jgi:4-hydroxy-3-polyprenylbenzoate decarboxylase